MINNNCIKELPESVGFLRKLHTLIADCNQLKALPSTICSCTKLRLLSLSHNEISHLPEDFGRLINLKVVNLRNNQLKYLPLSFANIPKLQTLWLSDNQQKPILKLQTDIDEASSKKVLTCFLLPQQSSSFNFEETYDSEHSDYETKEGQLSSNSSCRIKFSSHNSDELSQTDERSRAKLVRNPTPYPKEMKVHARHVRNIALRTQDSEQTATMVQATPQTHYHQAHMATIG